MSAAVAVVEVGGELGAEALAVLRRAERVIATRAELAAVRGLLPPDAVVDVLGDTAMDDPEGHRWDLPAEPEAVVVLAPPGDLATRILDALVAQVGTGRVAAYPYAGVPVVEPHRAEGERPPAPAGEFVAVTAGGAATGPGAPPASLGLAHLAHPAVVRVATAAGEPGDGCLVVSGARPERAVNACRRFPRVAVLTSPAFGPAELALALWGLEREFVVAERLGEPDERITRVPAETARTWRPSRPDLVLVLDPGRDAPAVGEPVWPPRTTARQWGLTGDAFGAPASTAAEVRALAIAWLGPGVGDLVWELGGGGSVAVEAALLGAAAIAVEPDPRHAAGIRTAAERQGVPVEVVQSGAARVLDTLPDPDGVFVGGGGGDVAAVVAACARRGPRAVVAALAGVEQVPAVRGALAGAALAIDGSLLQAARLDPASAATRFVPGAPVVLLAGRRR